MKRKLQRNDKRRSRNLTKIQVVSVPSLRAFWKGYAKYRASPLATGMKLARIRALSTNRRNSTFWPRMQGHYQKAWNLYNRTPVVDRPE